MKRRVFPAVAFGLALAAGPLFAGTIEGTVVGHGANVPESGGGGLYASMRYKFAQRIDYSQLTDFVVYIDQPVPGGKGAPAEPAVVTQRDVSFVPHVLPIMVGTRVRWPNADDIYHNVFSMSEAKSFDLGLYTRREQAKEVLFDKVGRVDVFCAIHAQMHCIVLVLPSAYFAKVDSHRLYRVAGVPAGHYRLTAWHERLPAAHQWVDVPAEGVVRVDFTLGLSQLPKG